MIPDVAIKNKRSSMKENLKILKPNSISVEGNITRTTFDSKELREYLKNVADEVLWVEDKEGNEHPIRVGLLRDAVKELDAKEIENKEI